MAFLLFPVIFLTCTDWRTLDKTGLFIPSLHLWVFVSVHECLLLNGQGLDHEFESVWTCYFISMRMYDSAPSREVCVESLLVSDCPVITVVALPCSPLQTWTHTYVHVCLCVCLCVYKQTAMKDTKHGQMQIWALKVNKVNGLHL